MTRSYQYHKQHTYPKLNRQPSFEELMSEQWRDCPSYPQWQASSLGRVRSAKTHHVQKLQVSHDGYGVLDNGRNQVSRIVADAFLPAYRSAVAAKLEVDHISGDKTDNRPCNLQLLDHKANVRKSFGKTIRIGSVIFPSVAAAAETYGRSRHTIRTWMEEGRQPQAAGGAEVELAEEAKDITGAVYHIMEG